MQYDVTVIGGGLAGLTFSCLMAGGGVKVACVERALPKNDGNLRTTAISYGSKQILEEAGIWQKIENSCPIEDIKIFDGDSPLLLSFLSREVEDKPFGWIVLNSDLLKAMRERAIELKVEIIVPATVKDFADGVTILEGGRKIESQLIVGADGKNSFVRGWMQEKYNLPVREKDYRQRAVLCTISHANPHNSAALEHFFPEGPLAALPMADDKGIHRSAVVFTEHGPERKSLMNLSEEMFEQKLKEKFPPEYGEVKLIGKRAAFPLTLVHAAEYIGPRMALVADAAHGIHPVAGQGLNLGFRDVRELAKLVIVAKEMGKDVGADELLETYQRRRRPDNTSMVAVTDALVRLFSNNLPPLRALRQAGLKAVARLPRTRRFFIKRAMGDF